MSKAKNQFSLSLGAAFALAALGAPLAASAGLHSEPLAQGYQLAANDAKTPEGKCGEGKCGAAGKKSTEGKCGEGKCGGNAKKTEGKCGADMKKKEGKCGEGKCGAKK